MIPIEAPNPGHLEVRILDETWAQPLAELFRALREAGDEKQFHPHPLTDEGAAMCTRYTGRDLYYVLVEGSRVLGYGFLRGWDEGYEVPSLGLAIHPAARGVRLGETFMHVLHVAARRRGAKTVRLKVYPGNVTAVRLYERLGYRFVGEEAGQLVGLLEL